jgi:hypothetical protein
MSTLPVLAQPVGPIVPAVPPVVYHHHHWQAHERERSYRHEQHRLQAQQRDLDARRNALHAQHHFNENEGFYGR